MTQQYESLSEKTKLIDIALKYTDGDMEKAKEMIAGQYFDITVIKVKFYNSMKNETGLLLAFINTLNEYISNITSVISLDETLYDKERIFEQWKFLFENIVAYKAATDMVEMPDFNGLLIDSFVQQDIFPNVSEMDLDTVTIKIEEALKSALNSERIQCQIDLETTSSLAMDLLGVTIDRPGKGDGQEGANEATVEDARIVKIESEADYILEGKVVVAPVKGKYINDIVIGEKIKVMLTTNDIITEKVLRALNAIDGNGTRFSINGRVKAKIPLEKSGYIIYALVAKGILAKIVEEENVKIMIERPVEESIESVNNDNKIIIAMAIVVGFIVISGIILLFLL